MGLLTRDDTAFVAIDFQERLVPAMSGKEKLTEKTERLAKGMQARGIPTVVTQQYTKDQRSLLLQRLLGSLNR